MSLPHEPLARMWSTVSATVHLAIVLAAWAGAVALLTGVLLWCASCAAGLDAAGLRDWALW